MMMMVMIMLMMMMMVFISKTQIKCKDEDDYTHIHKEQIFLYRKFEQLPARASYQNISSFEIFRWAFEKVVITTYMYVVCNVM